MTRLQTVLRQVARQLDRLELKWALVGGLAVSTRTEPRFTSDVDLAISVASDDEADAVVHRLKAVGYVAEMVLLNSHTHRVATVQLLAPRSSPRSPRIVVDLLFATSGIEPEVVANADQLEILPGLTGPVARAGHLIAMKVLSHDEADRPQDVVDIQALVSRADARDIRLARAAIRLMQARGYGRHRDLEAALERFLASRRRPR